MNNIINELSSFGIISKQMIAYSTEVFVAIALFGILCMYITNFPVTQYTDKKAYTPWKTKPPSEGFTLYEEYDNKKDNPILISMFLMAFILLIVMRNNNRL